MSDEQHSEVARIAQSVAGDKFIVRGHPVMLGTCVEVFFSLNYSFTVEALFVESDATLADIVPERTRKAMRELAREIYADIKPWLDSPC